MRRWILACLGIIVILLPASAGTSVDSAVLGSTTELAKPGLPSKGPFVVVVVVDAARYDQFDLSKMPNLSRLVNGGSTYKRAWVGQLPSITETSHATIGTGVFPSRHLILGDTWRIPGKDQMAPNLLDGRLTRTGYIGTFMRRTGSPSLASTIHKYYPGSVVAALSGHKLYAADALGAGSADFVAFGGLNQVRQYVPIAIPGRVPARSIMLSKDMVLPAYPRQPGLEDSWTTSLAEKFVFQYHPRLLMVNLPEVDTFGHTSGTNATVMQPLVSNVDLQIGRLMDAYQRAGLLGRTYWIVTADHAMVPAVHTVDYTRVAHVINQAGGDVLSAGHGDYCPIWLRNQSAVPRTAVALANANIPNVKAVFVRNLSGFYTMVSSPTHFADHRVYFAYSELLSTYSSGGAADIVLMYDENTMTMTPEFQKIARKGDHGGATWGAQHIPFVLAGPGIKHAYVSAFPARLVDVAPTIETLMGIKPQGLDGVPLADSMSQPPAWAKAPQTRIEARLNTDVSGLEAEASKGPLRGS